MPLISTTPYFVPEGPEGLGIMFGGTEESTRLDQYNMATDVASATGQTLSTSLGQNPGGFCDGTNAYSAGGRTSGNINTTSTTKYDLVSTVSVLGVNISLAKAFLYSFSNTTIGVISGGTTNINSNPFNEQSTIERFTFSGETWATATVSLALAKFHGCGYGNTTDGYSVTGVSNPISVKVFDREKYNYTGDTNTVVSSVLTARDELAGGSNETIGIHMGGNTGTNTTEKYTFSSEARISGTVLSGQSYRECRGMANKTTTLVAGSDIGGLGQRVSSYEYDTDFVDNKGDVLPVSNHSFGSCSTTHGGV